MLPANLQYVAMKKILIVNNDFDTMSLLKKYIEKYNYEVKFTGNGQDILQLVEKFVPDLCIIDIMQQKAITELKNHDATSMIPILMMTGYTKRGVNDQLPVDDFIEKPFDLNLLRSKIERLISATRKASASN